MKKRNYKNCNGFGLLQIVILVAILSAAGIGVFLWKELKETEGCLAVLSSARNMSTGRCEVLPSSCIPPGFIQDAQCDFEYNQQQEKELQDILKQEGVTDTSTWKTYRNEKYGFEIKHPPQLLAQEPVGLIRITTFNRAPLNFEVDDHASIEISLGSPSFSFKEYLKTAIDREYKEEVMKIGDVSATKITGILGSDVFYWGGGKRGYVIFNYKEEVFQIDYDLEDKEIALVIDQILSTFKFIE